MSNRTITTSKISFPLEDVGTIPVYNETGATNHKDTSPVVSTRFANEKEVPVYTANTVTLDIVKSLLPQNQELRESIDDPSGICNIKKFERMWGVLLITFLLIGLTIDALLGRNIYYASIFILVWFLFLLPYFFVVCFRVLESSPVFVKRRKKLEACINEMTNGGYSAIKALESADTDELIQDYIKSHKEVYAGIRVFDEELDAHIFVFFGSENHMIMVPSSNALRDLFSGEKVTDDDYETWRGFKLYVNFPLNRVSIKKTELKDSDSINRQILEVVHWKIKRTPGFFRVWPINNPDYTITIEDSPQLER